MSAPVAARLTSPEARMAEWTRREGVCLIWTGGQNGAGYGQMRADGKNVLAHRWAYEHAHGLIPSGMQVDHVCHNRACVEPSHLRLATPKQNAEHKIQARMDSRTGVRGVRAGKREGKWRAYVTHNGKARSLGTFATIAEAEEAARLKRLELFTHNNADRAA